MFLGEFEHLSDQKQKIYTIAPITSVPNNNNNNNNNKKWTEESKDIKKHAK